MCSAVAAGAVTTSCADQPTEAAETRFWETTAWDYALSQRVQAPQCLLDVGNGGAFPLACELEPTLLRLLRTTTPETRGNSATSWNVTASSAGMRSSMSVTRSSLPRFVGGAPMCLSLPGDSVPSGTYCGTECRTVAPRRERRQLQSLS